MFSRFSGISAEEYGRRTGQLSWVGGSKSPGLSGSSPARASLPQRPGGVKPSLRRTLGTVMTKPMCLCKLQRDADAAAAAQKRTG